MMGNRLEDKHDGKTLTRFLGLGLGGGQPKLMPGNITLSLFAVLQLL